MGLKKILFICGSLEPGRDGVGDYARELAGALLAIGVESKIIAIMDRSVDGIVEENQSTREREVEVIRLSKSLSFKVRKREYQNLVADFNPDFISLQFVPYAFSPKGIPLNLSRFLKTKDHNIKWHFMIHEGYIGGSLDFKNKIIQKIQIYILNSLVKKFEPVVIHTSTPLYQGYLIDIGINTHILGLFGNIPINQQVIRTESTLAFRGVYFGAAPQLNDFQAFVDDLLEYIQKTHEKIEIVMCGKSGESGKEFANFLRQHISDKRFRVIEKGIMSSEDLSILFLNSDFAIAREPARLLGKSGSAIAMLEHGLPMWVPLSIDSDQIALDFDFRVNQCYVDLMELKNSNQSFERTSRLQEIAIAFKESLICA